MEIATTTGATNGIIIITDRVEGGVTLSQKGIRIVIVVALVVIGLSLWLSPMARVDLFARIGHGEWAFRRLTTTSEKVRIANSHPLAAHDPAWPYAMSPHSGTSLVPYGYGKEMVWAISYEPFVLEVRLDDETYSVECIDENTLSYRSQEFPLEFVFTRGVPQPHYNNYPSDAVWFYKKASEH